MKLSILVPIYNSAAFLPLCLESITCSSFKDFEVLLIDDGSTDNSSEICKKYQKKDSRLKLFLRKNSGYGASLNFALKKAKGKYVAIVEPDDFIHRDMYKTLITALEKENADFSKSNFMNFYGKNWKTDPEVLFREKMSGKVPEKMFFVLPSIWSCVYKKDFLKKNHITFLESPGASFQDTSFQFKTFACAKKVAVLTEPLYYYRRDNSGSSVFASEKSKFLKTEFDETDKFAEKNRKDLLDISYQLRFRAYTWNLNRVKFKDAWKFAEVIISDRKNLNFNAKLFLKSKVPRAHEFKFATNHPKFYLILRPFFRLFYFFVRI